VFSWGVPGNRHPVVAQLILPIVVNPSLIRS
jgi:hypothetical protein